MGFEVQNGPDRLTMTRDGHEEQNGIFSEIFPKEKQYELIKRSSVKKEIQKTPKGSKFLDYIILTIQVIRDTLMETPSSSIHNHGMTEMEGSERRSGNHAQQVCFDPFYVCSPQDT